MVGSAICPNEATKMRGLYVMPPTCRNCAPMSRCSVELDVITLNWREGGSRAYPLGALGIIRVGASAHRRSGCHGEEGSPLVWQDCCRRRGIQHGRSHAPSSRTHDAPRNRSSAASSAPEEEMGLARSQHRSCRTARRAGSPPRPHRSRTSWPMHHVCNPIRFDFLLLLCYFFCIFISHRYS
jgi:hypothetical protein